MLKDIFYIMVLVLVTVSFVVFTYYVKPGDLTALDCPTIECPKCETTAYDCPKCECPIYEPLPIQCPPCEQLTTQDKAAKLILNMRPSTELSACAQYGWAIAKKQFIRDLDIHNAPKYGDFPIYTPENKCFTSNESFVLLPKYYDGERFYFILDDGQFIINKSNGKTIYYMHK